MHDPLLVRGLERLGDLHRDGERRFERQGSARDPLGQRLPFDELHHQEVTAAGLLQPVERGDVGMIERGERLGFALEPRHAIGIGGDGVEQQLHGDAASELRIARAIHLAHPAGAERVDDLVDAEPRTWEPEPSEPI